MPTAPQLHKTSEVRRLRLPRGGSPLERALAWGAMLGPVGLIGWGPGTWASLLTAVLWRLCIEHGPASLLPHGRLLAIALAGIVFVLGVPAAAAAARCLRSPDPAGVVVDEAAGQLLAFAFVVPVSWGWMLAGLAFFRLFDIAKPFPIRRLERLPGGWGIMADDLLAGFYAALALELMQLAVNGLR